MVQGRHQRKCLTSTCLEWQNVTGEWRVNANKLEDGEYRESEEVNQVGQIEGLCLLAEPKETLC